MTGKHFIEFVENPIGIMQGYKFENQRLKGLVNTALQQQNESLKIPVRPIRTLFCKGEFDNYVDKTRYIGGSGNVKGMHIFAYKSKFLYQIQHRVGRCKILSTQFVNAPKEFHKLDQLLSTNLFYIQPSNFNLGLLNA